MSDKTELLPTPSPVYPCKHCCSDYSWPADDLFWSASEKAWVCTNCWDDGEEVKGISLADELSHRPDALRVALEAATSARDGFARLETIGCTCYSDPDGCCDYCSTSEQVTRSIDDVIAALSASPKAPQYDESALDRFAQAGEKAWADAPEAAKLIRQVDPTGDSEAKKDGERLAEFNVFRNGSWVEDVSSDDGEISTTDDQQHARIFRGIEWVEFWKTLRGELCPVQDAARSRGEGKE